MKQLLYGELGSNVPCVAVIMAGGSGTRFWPMSRTQAPKQFLPLGGGQKSLIQLTAQRLEPLTSRKGIVVVTAEHQRELVQKHLPGVSILAEPCARNTAPCVGFAAKAVLESVGDIPMICLPADHLIAQEAPLRAVFEKGVQLARDEDVLVTIGIKPQGPETGYGYIRRGQQHGAAAGVFKVRQFVEKPNRETAERYLASGEFFWNSGMFIWRPSVLLREMERHLPELASGLEQFSDAIFDASKYEEGAAAYQNLSPVSVDVGVMERAENVLMLVGDSFDWSDVGSWTSWAETRVQESADESGNVIDGEAVLLDSESCAVVARGRLIAGVGLRDLVIVDTDDALLVCHKERSQDVKKIVELLKETGRRDLV